MIAPRASSRALPWLLLGLILLLAGSLRCWRLGRQSFWIDELFTLESMFGHNYAHLALPRNVPIWPATAYTDPRQAMPWWVLPMRMDHDLHSPLPYLLLRPW